MQNNSIFNHIKNIIILPFTVTVIIPYFLLPNTTDVFHLTGSVYLKIISILFFAVGISLFISTVYLFYKIGKGTLAPWNPTQQLVIAGPYKYVRNPMISGVLFILISEAFYFSSAYILLWAGLFFIINSTYFIVKEEPDLEKRFGEPYRKYRQEVPRWIPKSFFKKI